MVMVSLLLLLVFVFFSDGEDDDSFDDDEAGNILKTNELKDDKQIVKSAAQNDMYNLVERPRFLISFELRD